MQPGNLRRVYLAGPPYADECRRRASALIAERGWEPVDPMRRDFRGRTEGRERGLARQYPGPPDVEVPVSVPPEAGPLASSAPAMPLPLWYLQ